jgi:hypothetical protein
MVNKKHIIIPVGFNAEQSKEGVMRQMPASYAYEWMEQADFVKEYLYCAKEGPYAPPIEVWLLVWDSPSNMAHREHPNPKIKQGCSYTELALAGILVNLVWCRAHHAGLQVHLIQILPPRLNPESYTPTVRHHFSEMVEDTHLIDIQEELSKTSSNTPFSDFLEIIDLRVAEAIAGRKKMTSNLVAKRNRIL